jgi:hypothetical protein
MAPLYGRTSGIRGREPPGVADVFSLAADRLDRARVAINLEKV